MTNIYPTIDELTESTVMLNMRKLAGAVDKNNQTLQQNVQQAIDTANEAQEAVQGFDERIDANATAIQNEVTARQNADVTAVDVLYNAGEITVKLNRELGVIQDSVDAPFIKTATLIPTSTERAFKIRFTYYDDTTYDTNDFVIPEGGGTDVSVTGVTIEEGATDNTFKVSIKLSDATEIDSNEYPFPTAVTNPYPTAIMLSLGGTNDTTLNIDITLSDNNHETGSVELGQVFATKADLTGLQEELTSEITNVQEDLQEQITGLKLSKPNQNQIQLNGDNVSVIEKVSGEVVDGKLRLTVNGVTGSDIPLPETEPLIITPTREIEDNVYNSFETDISVEIKSEEYEVYTLLDKFHIDEILNGNVNNINNYDYIPIGSEITNTVVKVKTIKVPLLFKNKGVDKRTCARDITINLGGITRNIGIEDGNYKTKIVNFFTKQQGANQTCELLADYIDEAPIVEFNVNNGIASFDNVEITIKANHWTWHNLSAGSSTHIIGISYAFPLNNIWK